MGSLPLQPPLPCQSEGEIILRGPFGPPIPRNLFSSFADDPLEDSGVSGGESPLLKNLSLALARERGPVGEGLPVSAGFPVARVSS